VFPLGGLRSVAGRITARKKKRLAP